MKEVDIQKQLDQIMAIPEPNEKGLAIFRFGIHLLYAWNRIDLAESVFGKGMAMAHLLDPAEKVRFRFCMGIIQYYKKQEQQTLEQIYALEAEIKKSPSLQLQAELLPLLGQIFWSVGDATSAFECALQSVKVFEENGIGKNWLLYAFYVVGILYLDSQDTDQAEKYFLRGIEYGGKIASEDQTLQVAQGRLIIGLANVEIKKKQFDKAEKYLNQALLLQSETSNAHEKSRILTDLGKIQRHKGNLQKAMQLLQSGFDLRMTLPDKNPLITSYIELAELQSEMGNSQKSLDLLTKARPIAEALSAKAKLATIYQIFGIVHRKMGNFEDALHFYEKFHQIREEISGDRITTSVKNLQMRYEIEKSSKEAEIERLRNVDLKNAYQALKEKNQNILNSINYALRIQQAILPRKADMQAALDGYFILFRPRDIVSGDFYWLEKHNGKTFIAAVDCTGHGVPGAFMSMIANELLRRAIIEHHITEPGHILSDIHRQIRISLRQEESANNDGMDMAICVFDEQKNTIKYAGAKSPLIYWDGQALHEIPPTRFSIGGSKKGEITFESHHLTLNQKHRFYLLSDGFQDQFGGHHRRKYMKKQLKEDLAQSSTLPLEEQHSLLENNLQNWIQLSRETQIDDILVIGFELNPAATTPSHRS